MQGAGKDTGLIGVFGRAAHMLEGFPKLTNALYGALRRCQTLEGQVGALTEDLATTSSNLAIAQETLAATQGSLRQAQEEVGVRVDQIRIKDQEIKRLSDQVKTLEDQRVGLEVEVERRTEEAQRKTEEVALGKKGFNRVARELQVEFIWFVCSYCLFVSGLH